MAPRESSFDELNMMPPSVVAASTSSTSTSTSTTDQVLRQSTSKSDTVILFDWDDTLLASSWVSKHGLRPSYSHDLPPLPNELRQELHALENVVIDLLSLALQYGRVVIITAAESGWVELSAARFLPRCLRLLESTNVQIVSARTEFETQYPNQPTQWKVAAFHQQVFECVDSKQAFYNIPRHVISLGDSKSEREALITMAELGRSIYGKSIKFITRPTACELRQQVELVLQCFDDMCTHPGHLDLQLQSTR